METTSTVINPDGSVTTICQNGGKEVWRSTSVPPTPEQTNSQTLIQRMQTAITANDNFLGISSPANAQIVTQVQRLTKECNALIRLSLNQLSDVSDTA